MARALNSDIDEALKLRESVEEKDDHVGRSCGEHVRAKETLDITALGQT